MFKDELQNQDFADLFDDEFESPKQDPKKEEPQEVEIQPEVIEKEEVFEQVAEGFKEKPIKEKKEKPAKVVKEKPVKVKKEKVRKEVIEDSESVNAPLDKTALILWIVAVVIFIVAIAF